MEVAKARSAVASASASLEAAEEARDRLLAPTELDLAKARSAVTNAKASLESAKDSIEEMAGPTSLEVAQAEAAVANAKLAAQSAQDVLDTAKGGPTDEDIADAQTLIDSALTTVAGAEGDLKLTRRDWGVKVQAAEDAVESAEGSYREVFDKWLGIDIGRDLESSPTKLLSNWDVDLTSLFAPASLDKGFIKIGVPDDPNTPWNEVVVHTWLILFPGTIVATCDNEPTPRQGFCVGKEIDDSWQTLENAKVDLETVVIQSAKAVASGETVLSSAEQALTARRESLAELKTDPDPLDVEAKEKALALAKVKLLDAAADLDLLTGKADPIELEVQTQQVALAEANLAKAEEDLSALVDEAEPIELEVQHKQVALARANLELAKEELETLTSPPDPVDLDSHRRQVALAQAKLNEAEEDLDGLMNGADSIEVEVLAQQVALSQSNLDVAQAELDQLTAAPDSLEMAALETQVAVSRESLAEAQDELAELEGIDLLEVALAEADETAARASLAAALEALESGTLTAPSAGIISSVGIELGQQVNPNTSAMEIVDPSVVEVDGIVDEIDVLFVRVGARAAVTMDALPGQVLEGSVSSLATAAQNQQGVVSYPIRIKVEVPQETQLPEGLSAVAQVIIREDRDVVLVPIQALYGTFEQPVVKVKFNGETTERPVVLGNSDDFWVVVESGLNEGDQVFMEAQQATTGGSGFGAFRQFRAGAQGGGFAGGRGNAPRGGGGGQGQRR